MSTFDEWLARVTAEPVLEEVHVRVLMGLPSIERVHPMAVTWCKVWLDPASDGARAHAARELRRMLGARGVAALHVIAEQAGPDPDWRAP